MSTTKHTCCRHHTKWTQHYSTPLPRMCTTRHISCLVSILLIIAAMIMAGGCDPSTNAMSTDDTEMPARPTTASTDSATEDAEASPPSEIGADSEDEYKGGKDRGDENDEKGPNEEDEEASDEEDGFDEEGESDEEEEDFEDLDEDRGNDAGSNSDDGPSNTAPNVNMPTACTQSGQPPEGCECSNAPGFTTYTFEHKGEQRCLTVYTNPNGDGSPMPLIIEPDCYSANTLQGPFSGGPYNKAAADDIGFHYMDLTNPSGGWDFPNDNEINDSNYATQCTDTASNDIGYLKGVFMVVDQMIADGLVDPNKVFVHSFSQNSVFALFMATCFPDDIDGIYQGGSGLYSKADGSKALPGCEGNCKKSSFLEHGYDCVQQEPCTTCDYFPVLPVKTGAPIKSCIIMYDNDGAAHSTAVPAYKLLKEQGHQPELKIFAGNPATFLGDHDAPLNPWAWALDCLQLYDTCSDSCSASVVNCVEDFKQNWEDGVFSMDKPEHREAAVGHYAFCLGEGSSGACAKGCTPTHDMLTLYETPACQCDASTSNCTCQTSDKPGACE